MNCNVCLKRAYYYIAICKGQINVSTITKVSSALLHTFLFLSIVYRESVTS